MERKPHRRWFRFSLRTTLIAMAVLSMFFCYVLHEWQIVEERKAAFRAAYSHATNGIGWVDNSLDGSKFFIRRLFGDRRLVWIEVNEPVPEIAVARLRAAFPEAGVNTDLEERHFYKEDSADGISKWLKPAPQL